MKRLLTAFMAACLFLTAGCGAGTAPSAAEDVPAPSAAASSMDENRFLTRCGRRFAGGRRTGRLWQR